MQNERFRQYSKILYKIVSSINQKLYILQCIQCNMKLIISDASSLILLNKVKLVEKLAKLMSIKIPLEVKKEAVDIGKENNYQDAFEIERLINKNIVKVEEVKNNKKVDELMKGYNMEKGESEAVQLFRELNADLLATDDRNAINTCSLLNIPTSGSLAFVINFYRKNLISKEEGEEMINQLSVFGRYSIDIINKALNDLREVKR